MDRIMLKNPNTGRDDRRIASDMYDPVKRAILTALDELGEVPFSTLGKEVERRTDADLWTDSSVGWYTTSVKLDLEARGWLARHGSPQVLTLTESGRSELETANSADTSSDSR